jgi:hypothetical protein
MTSSRQVGHSLLTTLALMWLIRLKDFEAPQKLRPDFSVSTKERDFMTHEQWTVSVAIASWKNIVGRADKVFSTLTEEQFLQEVASISA